MQTHLLNPGGVLDRLREALGVKTDGALAKRLGVSSAAVSLWRSGANNPDLVGIIEVVRETAFSLDWIILGIPPARRAMSPSEAIHEEVRLAVTTLLQATSDLVNATRNVGSLSPRLLRSA